MYDCFYHLRRKVMKVWGGVVYFIVPSINRLLYFMYSSRQLHMAA